MSRLFKNHIVRIILGKYQRKQILLFFFIWIIFIGSIEVNISRYAVKGSNNLPSYEPHGFSFGGNIALTFKHYISSTDTLFDEAYVLNLKDEATPLRLSEIHPSFFNPQLIFATEINLGYRIFQASRDSISSVDYITTTDSYINLKTKSLKIELSEILNLPLTEDESLGGYFKEYRLNTTSLMLLWEASGTISQVEPRGVYLITLDLDLELASINALPNFPGYESLNLSQKDYHLILVKNKLKIYSKHLRYVMQIEIRPYSWQTTNFSICDEFCENIVYSKFDNSGFFIKRWNNTPNSYQIVFLDLDTEFLITLPSPFDSFKNHEHFGFIPMHRDLGNSKYFISWITTDVIEIWEFDYLANITRIIGYQSNQFDNDLEIPPFRGYFASILEVDGLYTLFWDQYNSIRSNREIFKISFDETGNLTRPVQITDTNLITNDFYQPNSRLLSASFEPVWITLVILSFFSLKYRKPR